MSPDYKALIGGHLQGVLLISPKSGHAPQNQPLRAFPKKGDRDAPWSMEINNQDNGASEHVKKSSAEEVQAPGELKGLQVGSAGQVWSSAPPEKGSCARDSEKHFWSGWGA